MMDVCRAGVAWKEVMSASTPLPETVASDVDFPADDLALEPSGNTNAASSSQPALDRLAVPETVGTRIMWGYLITFIALHLMLSLAFVPALFSWTGLLLVPLGLYVFDWVGIGLCYHRTLTHAGLIMPKWFEHTCAILGVCTLMDSPARWVAIHRKHHQHSDEQPDPHSPLVSFIWGHFGWLIRRDEESNAAGFYHQYAPDILRDPFYLKLERNVMWAWIYVAHAVAFFLVGFAVGWVSEGPWKGLQFGASLFVWGVVVRTLFTWHVTWAVNSVAHMWGYRNYQTRDNSRNSWIVALFTGGEGWHNNHHAHPVSAAHGHRWWEFDPTYWTICFLSWIGLAKEVKTHRTGRVRVADPN
ncbi:MAG: acyl-CoA desaturase [Planctomycetaceae bacterium]|nr:acyl-CoA desaturase [Planctomycetaceae bacterium]